MVILMMIVNGCTSAVPDSVICGRTVQDRPAHSAALALDGGPVSITTGRVLIAKIDAGCAE